MRDGLPSYYLTDGQGSVRALTDANGAISDTYAYTAFGELYAQSGATENSYLYTGQQFDGLTGLYSLRARYYDPGLGRFLSQDSAGLSYGNPVELNKYVYTANNPINRLDPSGLFSDQRVIYEEDLIATEPLQSWVVATPKVTLGRQIIRIIGVGAPFIGVGILILVEILLATEIIRLPIREPLRVPKPRTEPRRYPKETSPPPDQDTCTEGDPDCDDDRCDPVSFEHWWSHTLQIVPESFLPGNPVYEYEQRVARINGLYGEYSRDVPIPAPDNTVAADGIEPSICCLVDAKSSLGDQYRLNNPPPWIVSSVADQLRRYRLAILTPNGVPGAQPRGLIIRTNTTNAKQFFLHHMLLAGFVIGRDGFVELKK